MSPAVIIAVCLLAISLGSFVIFVAAACNASHNADDADEALIARMGDARCADAMNFNRNTKGE